MILDIDGKKFEDPDDATIANAFESIDKATGFRSGGLSLVILSRDKGNSLSAAGHPAKGWAGLNIEENGIDRTVVDSSSISQEKMIQIFQCYAKGDGAWEKEFQWNVIRKRKLPPTILLVAVFLGISFLVRSCVKGH
jgi:hypothetical protein